ncbi:L,D-transpeptidase [Leptolyngbya sp. AN02str]|uniref:L,D-transpeptidase n=1 Tax=Leptolyngbya sp. AN02str TaxID=3423363 RepID=UPI003D317358
MNSAWVLGLNRWMRRALSVGFAIASGVFVTQSVVAQEWNLSDESLYESFPMGDLSSPAERNLRIEIALSDRRLVVYDGDTELKSYPVAVGRQGWQTPVGSFEVKQMIVDPAWQHPFTGEVIPGGTPQNPLGNYWIGFWTDGTNWVGMHGTPNPETVGTAASHGCIRLYNEDIQELFNLVSMGTPVVVEP